MNTDPAAAPVQDLVSSLLTLDEISLLVSRNGNPSETLSNIATLIRQRLATDVCSVYLLEPDRANLVLAATVGLRPESVGQVRMRITEGLAGLVAEQAKPVVVPDASAHPRFKYFRDAGEDPFRTFMGVPVIDRGVLQGVLVVQTREARAFTDEEVQLFTDAGVQLSSIVSEARTVGQFVAPVHQRLAALAQNLWWSWDNESVSLFRDLDPVLWQQCDHNPIAMLQQIDIDQLESRAAQMALHGRINHAYRRLQEYLRSRHTWGARHASVLGARPVAYFSAEFGLHESMPIYSGGLGILAGDHLKSASDLGIPLVGIGLYYDQGYFRQRLDRDGWQHEEYIDVDHRLLPMRAGHARRLAGDRRDRDANRDDRRACVADRGRSDDAAAARLERRGQQSRGPRADRQALWRRRSRPHPPGAAAGHRRRQGAGRARHLTRRHPSQRGAQRVRGARAHSVPDGAPKASASRKPRVASPRRSCSRRTRRCRPATIASRPTSSKSTSVRCATAWAWRMTRFLALGRVNPYDPREGFCMTVLALKCCHRANAVSSLHGHVSRAMWTPLFPGVREEHIPIGHVTNGVHVNTWLAPQMRLVYDRHLGANWVERSGDPAFWDAVEDIDDGELWEAHQALKASLIEVTRRRVVLQAERRGEPASVVTQLRRALNRDALTIGFARRFATYKRANLLLKDLESLDSLLNHPQMPVQLVFAGKSHPLDGPGKTVLQEVARLARDPRFIGKIVFIEDYDINVGRHLVQGVDVWLNNPRRPLEACGTSGQKVVLNGALNLSVLDGWWAEAYDGLNGFAIGIGETHSSAGRRTTNATGAASPTVLRDEVVPMYYDRDRDGLPREWIARMKRAIRTLGWRFSAHRMVMDYVMKSYIPAAGGTSSDMRGF